MHLTPDQLQLRDTLRGLLGEKVTPEYRLGRVRSSTNTDSTLAQVFSELAFVEGFCGAQPVFSLSDLGVVAFEFGRCLLPEPYLSGLLLGAVASTLPVGLDKETLSALPPLSMALSSSNCITVTPAADHSPKGREVLISGVLKGVWLPQQLTRSDSHDKEGRGLFPQGVVVFDATSHSSAYFIPINSAVVGDGGAEGESTVFIQEMPSLDLLKMLKRIELNNAPAIAFTAETSTLLRYAASTIVANEMAGICDYVISLTSDYVKTRHQFGVPIGGFQAIQHSLATSYVEAESLRALASFAAWALNNSPSQRRLTSLSALVRAVAVAPTVCERAIQAHGGIGFTWEYELHLYLRRARATAAAWQMTLEDVDSLLIAAHG
jgi:hypothetical protein